MFLKGLYKIQNQLFDAFIIFSYVTYGLILFGFSTNAPTYLSYMDSYVQIYISLFLIIRFNPLRKIVFTDLDRKIGFSAGLFLFATTTINHFMINYFDNLKKKVFKNKKSEIEPNPNPNTNLDINSVENLDSVKS
jgi:hypothetical protein